MRKSVLGAAAIALLGTTALVSAQQGPQPGSGNQPAMKEQGQSGGTSDRGEKGAQRSPSSESKGAGEQKGDSRAQMPSDKGKGSAQGDTSRGEAKGNTAGSQEKADDTKRRAQSNDRNRSGKDAANDQRSQEGAKGRTAGEGTRGKDTDRNASKSGQKDETANDQRSREGDKGRSAEEGQRGKGMEKDKTGRGTAQDRTRDRDRQQAQGEKRGEGRVNLSEQQRTTIHEKLSSHREARVSNVNFSVNVGTRVPRNVHLQGVPADIVSIVPQYRGYRYFIASDRIVIVQPTTLEIVEVIDTGGPRRGGPVSASLELSPPQINLIFDRVDLSGHRADVQVDLALGAELPDRVELYDFPAPVISEVPELRRYRYVVVDREVVIVDPSRRNIVRVLKH